MYSSLAGRYDNPIPTRFLAPIYCLKIPAQNLNLPKDGIPVAGSSSTGVMLYNLHLPQRLRHKNKYKSSEKSLIKIETESVLAALCNPLWASLPLFVRAPEKLVPCATREKTVNER